jgi:hypothetical protein
VSPRDAVAGKRRRRVSPPKPLARVCILTSAAYLPRNVDAYLSAFPAQQASWFYRSRSNAGVLTFSHFRQGPLQYAPPRRFDTMPSTPSSQAFANTSSPSSSRASLNMIAPFGFNQNLKLGAPHFKWELAEIFAIDAEKIKRHEVRALAAILRSQRRRSSRSFNLIN